MSYNCRLINVAQQSLKVGSNMAYFVHESSYVDSNVQIGDATKVWHFCHIQEGAVIGSGCSLGQNVNISNNVHIGNQVKIQNNVSVYEGVTIEDGVFLGPSCVFTNDLTPRAKYPKGRKRYVKTLIKEGASIGANATIVCGHSVGRYAMVAAGSVVTKDVPDYCLVAGIPARCMGWVCECGMILDESLSCHACGKDLKTIIEVESGVTSSGDSNEVVTGNPTKLSVKQK